MTSSAVSQHMSALQKETGLTLFERRGRGIEPTAAAHTLARESEGLLAEVRRVDSVVDELRDGTKGSLSIGYFSSAGSAWMPRLARQLLTEMPDLTLQLVLTEAFAPGDGPPVDIDIVPDDPASSIRPGHHVTPLVTDPFVALLPVDHSLARRRRVAMAELADETWISNDIAAGVTHSILLRACRAAGFTPRFAIEAQDHYSAIAFVAAGVGITVVTDLASRGIARSVRRVHLTEPSPVRDIVVLTSPTGQANPATRRAVQILTEVAASSGRSRRPRPARADRLT